MSMLFGPISSGACTGGDGAGAATGTSTHQACGFVWAVYVQYVGDDPATTDITVKTLGTSPRCPSYNILVKADSATDAMYLPRMDTNVFSTGAVQGITDALIPVDDFIQVVVAQANDGDVINIWLFLV